MFLSFNSLWYFEKQSGIHFKNTLRIWFIIWFRSVTSLISVFYEPSSNERTSNLFSLYLSPFLLKKIETRNMFVDSDIMLLSFKGSL